MFTVSFNNEVKSENREITDSAARNIVLSAFRAAPPSTTVNPQAQFNAALDSYCKAYPHIAKPIAGRAVAYILATEGDRE